VGPETYKPTETNHII